MHRPHVKAEYLRADHDLALYEAQCDWCNLVARQRSQRTQKLQQTFSRSARSDMDPL